MTVIVAARLQDWYDFVCSPPGRAVRAVFRVMQGVARRRRFPATAPARQHLESLMRKTSRVLVALAAALVHVGCHGTLIRDTDRGVYRVIAARQRDALGVTSSTDLQPESGDLGPGGDLYSFVPRPTDSAVPESFTTTGTSMSSESIPADQQSDDNRAADTEPDDSASPEPSPSIFSAEDLSDVQVFGLYDALAYAMGRAREVQDAKEDLFLATLDLTLERHLWTPQFVATVTSDYSNLGQSNDFQQALTTVAEVAVTQQLPLGGEVTARVIADLVRDLSEHITSGESGDVIVEANIPLFRGAGRTAYESRYRQERALIYAVRAFEDFRRSFAVRVAGQYFDLQQRKAAINNAYKSFRTRKDDWERADFINQMGRSRSIFDASRARSSFRQAESVLVSAKEAYASALDRFKIVISMPIDTLLDVVDQEVDLEAQAIEQMLTDVTEAHALAVALRSRLDLLTSADRVDDARRGVLVAKNAVLPDLDIGGSVTFDSEPDRLRSTTWSTERANWTASATLAMDDRKAERNAYRAALVAVRRAERDHDRFVDVVRSDVRRAIRGIEQQSNLLQIQASNVDENELRYEAANAQFELGLISNQDVVDADTDLLRARNDFAAALSAYRNAILEYRRDTGTLRVQDDGRWGS
jgi:outer membrane protein TolC